MPLALMACEYGPIAPGALSVDTISFMKNVVFYNSSKTRILANLVAKGKLVNEKRKE